MMWAEVELNDSILEFINYEKSHNESFEEMRNLVFTQKRLNTDYSVADMFNLNNMFQKIKASALEKVLNKQKLNYAEGFVFERLLMKYENKDLKSVEEHFQEINRNSYINRDDKRKKQKKCKKLYEAFIKKVAN